MTTERLCSFSEFDCRGLVAPVPPRHRFVENKESIGWIRAERTIVHCFGFCEAPHCGELICQPEIGSNVVWVDGDRALRGLDHLAIAASGKINVAERRISLSTFRVEGNSPPRGKFRLRPIGLPIGGGVLRLDR